MDMLKGLEPDLVFHYFEALSDIPRGSGSTEAVKQYLLSFASEKNLEASADDAGNVLIRKAGSEGRESAAPVILQSHMDMVCVKTADSDHDCETQPLDLFVEGDQLYADGTSLGGDDGIGVALTLAVLADDTLEHPPIEAVFTTDEEIGLLGASAFDTSLLRGRRMINLDSEKEGVFTCGCAGGSRVNTIVPIERMRMRGLPVMITVTGLQGGHSGEEITKWRANANKVLGRLLYYLGRSAAFSLESVSGGEKDNAIPTEAKAGIVIDEEDYPIIVTSSEKFEREIRKEYRGIDENIHIGLTKGNAHKLEVMSMDSQDHVISFLLHTPDGISQLSGTTPGLPQTSCNLGVIRTGVKEFAATTGVRSSVESARHALELSIRDLSESIGGGIQTVGEYPAWEFRQTSPLRETMVQCYTELNGSEPVVNVIHAGLECGLFASKMRGLDAVSIGPELTGIHTPDEKLSISSVGRTWALLTRVLAALN